MIKKFDNNTIRETAKACVFRFGYKGLIVKFAPMANFKAMRIFIVGALLLFLVSCSPEKKPDDQEFLKSLEATQEKTGVDEEVINSIFVLFNNILL